MDLRWDFAHQSGFSLPMKQRSTFSALLREMESFSYIDRAIPLRPRDREYGIVVRLHVLLGCNKS
jgi:hypothetical protein